MRRLGAFFVGLIIAFAFVFSFAPIERVNLSNITAKADEALSKQVYVGGMSAGFTLGTGGAQVIGLCEVMTENAVKCPAAEVGIRAGDIIFKANGKTVDSVGALNDILSENEIKKLLELLNSTSTLLCPHGRPIIIELTKNQIEKWFKRIV